MNPQEIEGLRISLTMPGPFGGIAPGSRKYGIRKRSTAYLKLLAKQLGLAPGTYTIRFNPAGEACSGEASLTSDTLYVCIQAIDYGVLYRSRAGTKDGPNQWWPWSRLQDIDGLAAACRRLAA